MRVFLGGKVWQEMNVEVLEGVAIVRWGEGMGPYTHITISSAPLFLHLAERLCKLREMSDQFWYEGIFGQEEMEVASALFDMAVDLEEFAPLDR